MNIEDDKKRINKLALLVSTLPNHGFINFSSKAENMPLKNFNEDGSYTEVKLDYNEQLEYFKYLLDEDFIIPRRDIGDDKMQLTKKGRKLKKSGHILNYFKIKREKENKSHEKKILIEILRKRNLENFSTQEQLADITLLIALATFVAGVYYATEILRVNCPSISSHDRVYKCSGIGILILLFLLLRRPIIRRLKKARTAQ